MVYIIILLLFLPKSKQYFSLSCITFIKIAIRIYCKQKKKKKITTKYSTKKMLRNNHFSNIFVFQTFEPPKIYKAQTKRGRTILARPLHLYS